MFKIRSEHITTFQPQAETAFVGRVMEYLRKNHSDAVVRLPKAEKKVAELSDSILQRMVAGGVGRARKYDITWKSTLISFVVLMFLAAPNFDEHALAKEVLGDEKNPADSRVDKLMERMTDENWEEVEKNYNRSLWRSLIEGAEV